MTEIKSIAMPAWKRVLDLLILLVFAPIVMPVGLLIAFYIRLVSPGPVLFRQIRIGRAGAPFTCFKFRTMKANAPTTGHEAHLRSLMRSDAPMVKLDRKGDPRLIPGGALLRASGLDELGQLINVLRGEMSMVGPRPCLPYEFAEYQDHHKERLAVLPGITGLWQVGGKNKTTFEEMIALDVRYAKSLNMCRDLRILLRTVGVLVAQIWETALPDRVSATNTKREYLTPIEARK